MSGRARLTVCAAAASVMAACALLPLVSPAVWIVQAAFLVALQSGVGVLARRVPLARPLTIAAQFVVSLLVLTVMFVRGMAVLGFVPGPAAFVRLGELLTEGGRDVGQYAIPAPVTPGIRLMLLGGVLLIALMVDALAVTYGSAAPAGLPLLAMYSVAAGLSNANNRSSWIWFLVAATGYLVRLPAAGRDRRPRWGRVFGGPSATAGYGSPPPSGNSSAAPVRTGRRIGAATLGVALIAPAMLPSLGSGLLNAAGTGSGVGGGTISAVNPVVALKDQLNQSNNQEVLTYRTSATSGTSDLYLRIVALDQFDGAQWLPAKRPVTDVPNPLPAPPGLQSSVQTTRITTSVAADKAYAQSWLPLPYPATEVKIGGRWRFEPLGRTIIGDRGQYTSGTSYEVTSLQVQPTAEQLAAAPAPNTEILRDYTAVPDGLPALVGRTAVEITSSATNSYQKAVALQRWFTSGAFTYSTQVSSGTGVDAITRFLRDKQGFCVHFAFTMAAMARTLGIPARVAVGFTPGTPQGDGLMSVGMKDAHAWPELYFEGIGWTRFEPTPSRGTAPGYTVEQTPVLGDTATTAPTTGGSATETAAPSASESCTAQDRRAGDCGQDAQLPGGGPADGGLSLWLIARLATLAVLVLLVPALPMLWRRRERARRLGGGRGQEPEPARIMDGWRELTDAAWDYGVLPDESETPRRAAARLIHEGRLDEPAAEAVRRVATAVEQALYSPQPHPVTGVVADVRLAGAGLRRAAGRAARFRAAAMPRSAVRVTWQLSAAWASLQENASVRWAAGLRRVAVALRRPSGQSSP